MMPLIIMPSVMMSSVKDHPLNEHKSNKRPMNQFLVLVVLILICFGAAALGALVTIPQIPRLVRGARQADMDTTKLVVRAGVECAVPHDGSRRLDGVA